LDDELLLLNVEERKNTGIIGREALCPLGGAEKEILAIL